MWFSAGDLRVADHLGLATAEGAVGLYVVSGERGVDAREAAAVRALRAELRRRGSDLVVRRDEHGGVAGAVRELGAVEVVHAHAGVDAASAARRDEARAALEADGVELREWDAPLWADEAGALAASDARHDGFERRAGDPLAPVGTPEPHRLVALPDGFDAGELPEAGVPSVALPAADPEEARAEAELLARGEAAVEGALRFALRAGTAGAPFGAAFGTALALGVLSPRVARELADAAAEAGARPAPPLLAQLGLVSAPRSWAEDAASEVRRAAFHRALAAADAEREVAGAPDSSSSYWRWRGMLIQYVDAGGPPDAPPVLLVHGFGGFAEHFRRTYGELSETCRVYAVTFCGFGRSEKPGHVPYSQDLWAELLRDFLAEVVGRPAFVVGNSIGGFMCSTLAANYPDTVLGLILMNSAGLVKPGWEPAPGPPPTRKTPGVDGAPAWVSELVTAGLLWYLQPRIPKILKDLYPTEPANVDRWLADEIYRASVDPGAAGVFASVFYLPTPRPINYNIDLFGKPVLVLQGRKDPLNDAEARAEAIAAASPANVSVELLEAGHCPMDERPALVNAAVAAFVATHAPP